MSPFVVVAIGIACVVLAIAVFRLHPFFALLIAAVLVGILSPKALPGPEGVPQATRALQLTTDAFGDLAGKIGVVIAFAAVIGQAMMESGAADKITRRLLALLGERRANYALLGSGYVLSVPVFFDTVFFLLVPLARALSLRTGRNFVFYVLAICAGGVVTHGLVPPTPGPLTMVEYLHLDLGVAIVGGFLIGLPVAWSAGILLPKLLVRWVDPPLRDTAGSSVTELEALAKRPESELPGFVSSILPVILPVVLITTHTAIEALYKNELGALRATLAPGAGLLAVSSASMAAMGSVGAAAAGAVASAAEMSSMFRAVPESVLGGYQDVLGVTSFLGEKTFALGAGTALALWVLARQKRWSMRRLMDSLEPAIAAAGTIILITCAGGAFGTLLNSTGLGDELRGFFDKEGSSGPLLILVAYGIAAVMKIAQGSGTAAMVIGSQVMAGILDSGVELPFHKIYIFAAIAYGSKSISWMNDSGFWVVCKMSGFTQQETLKTWTVQLAYMSVLGLVEVLILSKLLPFAG